MEIVEVSLKMEATQNGFYVAAYAIDGQCEGTGFWDSARLSRELIEQIGSFLVQNGDVFSAPLEGEMSQFSLQFTSANGAAIATLSVRDNVAASILLRRGESHESEASVSQMFIESARRSGESVTGNLPSGAFASIANQSDRPLMVVIPWASDHISDDDFGLVQEVSIHLGAAFFMR